MTLEDRYNLYCKAYYGICEMDNYDLKVYVLKEIEKIIDNFKKEYGKINLDYDKHMEYVKDNISIRTKLQSSLLLLNEINGPMELILLIKLRLKEEK